MQQEMFLFIADISGYTSYMIRNEMESAHGTLIISELIKSLIKEVAIPMEISKLEGDAIFLFLPKEKLPSQMQNDPELLTRQLLRFFTTFSKKIAELACSTACDCGACAGIDQLNLKIVAHYGKATVEQIGPFKELSGVDVILVHRLLKNQVEGHCYLLVTDSARRYLSLPLDGKISRGVEHDKDLGAIPITVYSPLPDQKAEAKRQLTRFGAMKSRLKLAMGSALLKHGVVKQPEFHNFPTRAADGQPERKK
jgi:Protein of unknown function (DUF2652)